MCLRLLKLTRILCTKQETRIHMAQVTEKKKLPRHIYKRPEWIVEPGMEPRRPPLPEMEEGCARASPYVRKSFSEKVLPCTRSSHAFHCLSIEFLCLRACVD